MGKEDDAMYDYFSKSKYFADIFNAKCFDGRQVLRADDLLEADGRSPVAKKAAKFRDIKKYLRNGSRFTIMAIENQHQVDFEMPLRIMQYDCAEYQKQLQQLHDRKAKECADAGKKANPFVVKMNEDDKLWPVYTICLYHGRGMWEKPLSLKDMMDFRDDDEAWQSFFADYPLLLVNVEDEALADKCHTDVKQFLKALAARHDKGKMNKLLRSEEFRNLEPETDRVLAVMLDINISEKMHEQEINPENDNAPGKGVGKKVCIAIDEMMDDAREEGREEGKNRVLVSNIENAVQNFKISLEDACKGLGTTVENYERAKQLLQV